MSFIGGTAAAAGQWTHLALVRDNGTTTFYMNGSPSGSTVADSPRVPTERFVVGAKPQTLNDEFFTGDMDEVRVFRFAPGGFSPDDLLYFNRPPTATSGARPNTFHDTGSLFTERRGHTATLLPNGKVLVAGGVSGAFLASAEWFDPATGTWTPTGPLGTARVNHTATLLSNGKVLIAGGENLRELGADPLASAELYDPATGTWTPTGSLGTSRYAHTARS